jgi:7-cyano-7-deazaguanine synthase
MNASARRAVVLFSGGMDSTTCLLWAQKNFDDVLPLTVDYGQRHAVEIECARRIARELGMRLTEVRTDEFRRFSDDALTRADKPIVEGVGLPTSFVPGRNLSFLLTAARYAYYVGAGDVVAGMCQTDYSGYPDCREAFVVAAEKAISLAFDVSIRIHTPLMHLSKAQTWRMADELGGLERVRFHSHTCYYGLRDRLHDWGYGCGDCPACRLRQKGWEEFVATYGTPTSAAPQNT